MAKAKVNEALKKELDAMTPANPVLSSADKAYLRGLMRRGFSEQQIRSAVQKVGMEIPANFFEKINKPKTTI